MIAMMWTIVVEIETAMLAHDNECNNNTNNNHNERKWEMSVLLALVERSMSQARAREYSP